MALRMSLRSTLGRFRLATGKIQDTAEKINLQILSKKEELKTNIKNTSNFFRYR